MSSYIIFMRGLSALLCVSGVVSTEGYGIHTTASSRHLTTASTVKGLPPATKVGKRLPMVFILGPMKSASTSLWEMVVRHPQLCRGKVKETNFFGENFSMGKDKYVDMFYDPKCLNNLKSWYVDGTPNFHMISKTRTLFSKVYSPAAMANLKFIIALREPVARLESYFRHFTAQYFAERGFFSKVQTFKERFDNRTLFNWKTELQMTPYAALISEFCKTFRRNQLLVLSDEYLFHNTPAAMGKIAAFLGVHFPTATWGGQQLPNFDHFTNKVFHHSKAFIDCVKAHVPHPDCDFIAKLAAYTRRSNVQLYTHIKVSHQGQQQGGGGAAHPAEPPFKPFPDVSAQSMHCVEDARASYNKFIENDLQAGHDTCNYVLGAVPKRNAVHTIGVVPKMSAVVPNNDTVPENDMVPEKRAAVSEVDKKEPGDASNTTASNTTASNL